VSLMLAEIMIFADKFSVFRAVLTLREGGDTTFQKVKASDVPILFRSYDHRARHQDSELNPRILDHSKLAIDKACSCTSAGPTYFRKVKVNGRFYIDGGVTANNPSFLACDEAVYMANPPTIDTKWEARIFPKLVVSVGTGKAKQHSRFGSLSILLFIFKNITETTSAHKNTASKIRDWAGSHYFRFDVPENQEHVKGLSHVGMDQCKKSRKRGRPRDKGHSVASAAPSTLPDGPSTTAVAHTGSTEARAPPPTRSHTLREKSEQEDRHLQLAATEKRPGGYKPQKYQYKTFEQIRDRTAAYLHTDDTESHIPNLDRITECAQILREQSLRRRNLPGGRERWEEFRRHPDPKYQQPVRRGPGS
jgi:hypothetical protein